ncbi:MAG TPA: hypothetical protein ENL44_03280 [Thermoplasmatales archaeon]|nr:hypothetical protein [Thermoplasmata archaeon]HHF59202.1 hypothetical protein [Thermoplasmatales archaeon]
MNFSSTSSTVVFLSSFKLNHMVCMYCVLIFKALENMFSSYPSVLKRW